MQVWGQLIICYIQARLSSRRTKTVLKKREVGGGRKKKNHCTILRSGHTATWNRFVDGISRSISTRPGRRMKRTPTTTTTTTPGSETLYKVSPDGLIYLLLLSARVCSRAQWRRGSNASSLLFCPALVMLGDGDRRWVLPLLPDGAGRSFGVWRLGFQQRNAVLDWKRSANTPVSSSKFHPCRKMIWNLTELCTCRGCTLVQTIINLQGNAVKRLLNAIYSIHWGLCWWLNWWKLRERLL